MSKADKISGLFWLFFGILVSVESARLGLGTLHRPGPGFLFFYTGIFVSIISLIILTRAFLTKKMEGVRENIFGASRNIWKAIYVLIAIFLYALLMEPLGFIPVTLLLFLFILGILERKRWIVAALTSLAVTVSAYLIFETALQSQLPKGILGFLRF
jgi:putative tricarboxylic transport membrane protein